MLYHCSMTAEELHHLIDYVKETEEALHNWDMDSLAMQTELPKTDQRKLIRVNKTLK